MQPEYAIFDMDGTLLDSMGAWKNLGRDYLISQGITPPENLLEILKAQTLLESAAYFRRELGVKKTEREILAGIDALIAREYAESIPLKPYVREYLKSLSEKGICMCVATATPRALAETALQRLQIREYFAFVLDCDEAGFNKNTPEIYQMAAQRIGGDTGNTVVYEDALHAAKTAKAAGFQVVGVYEENFSEDADAMRETCDRMIRSWQELL